MTQRNRNFDKGQAAQAAGMIAGIKRALSLALIHRVCPECGGALVREGNGFACTEPECEGVAHLSRQLMAARVLARQE